MTSEPVVPTCPCFNPIWLCVVFFVRVTSDDTAAGKVAAAAVAHTIGSSGLSTDMSGGGGVGGGPGIGFVPRGSSDGSDPLSSSQRRRGGAMGGKKPSFRGPNAPTLRELNPRDVHMLASQLALPSSTALSAFNVAIKRRSGSAAPSTVSTPSGDKAPPGAAVAFNASGSSKSGGTDRSDTGSTPSAGKALPLSPLEMLSNLNLRPKFDVK